MSELQSGIVAFLFTDIEGSTRLWESDQDAMSAALSRHDALLHDVIAAGGGRVFKTAGDAFCAVFPSPSAAILAAIDGQRAIAAEAWQTSAPLRVRMAVHAGHAESRGGDYFGPPLNRVARLLATGHGEQIVVSRAASELARTALPAEVSLRDLGEYRLKDLQQPERIFQVVATGLRQDFAPLRTPERLLRNLPVPATPLIGRRDAISAARAALGLPLTQDSATSSDQTAQRQAARLLTVTGPGGTGKTRLALHLARELGLELEDGAIFVPLAAVTDPALVPVAISSALELGENSAESPRQLVFEQLRERNLLLVLDNFEQVMGAADLVADLLSHCPRLLILVTSRERLGVRGESEFPLPPLELPAPVVSATSGARQPLSLDQIRCSPAVQLFTARAQSVKPDFAVTAENAETIADICRRLDGLPLAIELAAARARLLSPQALLERFDRRLDVLSKGSRDLPARQKTMRVTIAWSYDLLDSAEQQLFARLAVFVGGATLAAVGSVTTAAEDADLDLLESLADKSLLRLSDDDGEPRLSIFETIRDYARERLAESGEQQTIEQRHADFFLALAEESEPLLAGREQTTWLSRLERDQANLRAAIAWFREQGRAECALRLSGALWRYWWLRGDIGEGRSVLEALLNETPSVDPAIRAKALNGAGVLAESQGDRETAARLHQESLEISRRIGDLRGVAWSLNNLGVVEINQGNFDRANALLEESLAAAEQANDTASIATILIDLEQIANFQGDPERSIALLTRSLELFRALGDESYMARALNNLGTGAFERGELDLAHNLLTESLSLHRSVGDRQGIASTLSNLALVVNGLGDTESAKQLYLESHMLAMEGGNRLYAAIAIENLAALTRAEGESNSAAAHFREALLLYRAVDDQQGIVSCLANLASIAVGQGDLQQSAVLLGFVSTMIDTHENVECPDIDATLRVVRAELGDALFEATWQAGRAMASSEVIDQLTVRAMSPRLSCSA